MKNKGIFFCLVISCCWSTDLIASSFIGRDTILIDSMIQPRVDFISLFTVSPTGNKLTPFEYQMNDKAISFIQTYMDKNEADLKKMKTWAKPYFNLYDAVLQNNGVPIELKYLSVIESSLNSNIVSSAGAVGPWQIMPAEATRLGLKLIPSDERTDYQKSTQAAATLLKELYAEFGDWLLVVAAYNGGAGRLRKVIEKLNTKNFWELQYALPLETRNHVKKFIATQYVFESFQMPNSFVEPKVNLPKKMKEVDTLPSIQISGRYNLDIISKFISFPVQKIRELNPMAEKVLATGKNYSLRLPKDKLDIFEAHKNEILQASLQFLYQIDN